MGEATTGKQSHKGTQNRLHVKGANFCFCIFLLFSFAPSDFKNGALSWRSLQTAERAPTLVFCTVERLGFQRILFKSIYELHEFILRYDLPSVLSVIYAIFSPQLSAN